MPTSLTERYAPAWPEPVRVAGEALFRNGSVRLYRTSPESVLAEVSGDVFGEVSLDVAGNRLRVACDCSAGNDGLPCPHSWGVLCAADAFGDLVKAGKRGTTKVPLFARAGTTDPAPQAPADAPRRRKTAPARPAPHAPTPYPAHAPTGTPSRTAHAPGRNPEAIEILYVVSAAESRGDDVVLRTEWRPNGEDGRDGRPRPFVFDPAMPPPSPTDAAFHAVLAGKRDRADRTGNVYRIPPRDQLRTVRGPAGEGRLFLRDEDGSLHALQWSGDDPWKVRADIEEDGAGGCRALVRPCRDRQTIDPASLCLVTPGGLIAGRQGIGILAPLQATALLRPCAGYGPVTVSDAEADRLIDAVLDCPGAVLGEVPERLRYETCPGEPTPCLFVRTARYKYRGREQLHAELTFRYGAVAVPECDPRDCVADRARRRLMPRNRDAEEGFADRLPPLGFRRNTDSAAEELGLKLHPSQLDAAVRDLVERGWLVTAQGKTYRRPVEKSVRVGSAQDWFEIRGGVDFGTGPVPLPDLLKACARGAEAVRLDDGTYGLLPLEWLNGYTVLTEVATEDGDALTVPRTRIAFLDALLADKAIDADEAFAAAREAARRAPPVSSSQPPGTFRGVLRGYQREGLGWMRFLVSSGLGGCLADDMGLGKTVQVLAHLEWRRTVGRPGKPSLAVLPASLLFNWREEAARFVPDMTVAIHAGPGRMRGPGAFRGADLYLTTYGTLRNDAEELSNVPFDVCVLDESQAIKNADSATAKAACLIRADHRLVMTGTPIENSLAELLSQFRFLNPSAAAGSPLLSGLTTSGTVSPADAAALRKALAPLVLRRTKKQVAPELPPKTEQVITVELPDGQRERYDELREYYRSRLAKPEDGAAGSGGPSVDALTALLRLRQTACHPGLVDPDLRHLPAGKSEFLAERIADLTAAGHKILVFSQFPSFLRILRDRLAPLEVAYLDGATRDRGEEVRRFGEPDGPGVFLISLKAGGTGLNLTAADYVFITDPWWNPAAEAQAVDRAYRIGQTRPVFAYRLIAEGTVEEKMLELQARKRRLSDDFMSGALATPVGIGRDDVAFLLGG